MKKLFGTFLLFAASVFGQTGFVTVQDTLYLADGTTPFSGTLIIKWPTFVLNGSQIGLGSMNVQVANGALKVALWPSDQALIFNPDDTGQYGTGFLYQVFATSSQGPIINSWLVPSTAVNTTVALSVVRPPATAGGGSPYASYSNQTSAIPMTGFNVAIYTVASVPALAAGHCYQVTLGLLAASVGTNVFVFVDSTQIIGPLFGSAAYEYALFSYCNNPGSQTVQSINFEQSYYIVSSSLPVASNTTQTFGAVFPGTPSTPTGVTWSSSHTITVYANAASGNVTGAFLKILQQ